MAFDPGAVGRAFSEHRFDDALDHLASDVRWTIVGYPVIEGDDAVRRTCRNTVENLESTSLEFDRCVATVGSDAVAVDTVVLYVRPAGVTVVAGCAIYEFDLEKITAITSYAVEVDAGAGAPPSRV